MKRISRSLSHTLHLSTWEKLDAKTRIYEDRWNYDRGLKGSRPNGFFCGDGAEKQALSYPLIAAGASIPARLQVHTRPPSTTHPSSASSFRTPTRSLPWHSFDDKDYEFVSTYRRRFSTPAAAKGKRVFVDFEGAMTAIHCLDQRQLARRVQGRLHALLLRTDAASQAHRRQRPRRYSRLHRARRHPALRQRDRLPHLRRHLSRGLPAHRSRKPTSTTSSPARRTFSALSPRSRSTASSPERRVRRSHPRSRAARRRTHHREITHDKASSRRGRRSQRRADPEHLRASPRQHPDHQPTPHATPSPYRRSRRHPALGPRPAAPLHRPRAPALRAAMLID